MADLLLLCYHAISDRFPAGLSLSPKRLEAHLDSLAKRGYEGVTISEAISGELPARAVAITFDDAYASVHELALPILAEAGFVATLFVPSELVERGQPMSWPGVEHWLDGDHRDEMLPMSWPQVRELAHSGWEIGSHSRTHARLTELDRSRLDAELRGSRTALEERLGLPCRVLAYPFGAYSSRVIEATQAAGYSAATATLPGRMRPATGPYDWPRIVIDRSDSAVRFRLKTSQSLRQAKSSSAWTPIAGLRRAVRRQRT